MEEIRNNLFPSESSLLATSVVTILGGIGSGKTYLAQLLYNDSMAIHDFKFRAWISVSTVYDLRDVLESWLCYLDPQASVRKGKVAELNDKKLTECIAKKLADKKFFIVVDGVLSNDIWDNLKPALPKNELKSRVIVTTTLDNVVRYVKPEFQHNVPLTEPEGKLRSQLTDAEAIIKKFKGLPLGLAVVAGMLKKKNISERTLSALGPVNEKNNSECLRSILDFCYEKLSSDLKSCCVYLGLFPPERVISVEKLYLLWISDGIASTLEDAQKYLEELIDRNLVDNVENDDVLVSERFASFKLHRSVQERWLEKAKGENVILGRNKAEGKNVFFRRIKAETRRLAVHLNELKDKEVPYEKKATQITSILIFDVTNKNDPGKSKKHQKTKNVLKYKSTKVLDFNGVDFRVENFPEEREKLDDFKYLSFQGCYLNELPALKSTFPSVETLDLRVHYSCKMTIPNVLCELSRLKHLYFPQEYKLTDAKEKLNLSTLTSLEILENFHAGKCNSRDLRNFENLQSLTVIIDAGDQILRTVGADVEYIIGAMNRIADKMESCEYHTSLVVKNFSMYPDTKDDNEKISLAVKEILKCDAINVLDIQGNLKQLPPLHTFVISEKFTKIVFRACNFGENPLPKLGKLRGLKSLVLCEDVFKPEKMEMKFGKGYFRQLASLELDYFSSLKKFTVEREALSRLAVLKIKRCDKLEKLPNELAEMEKLQKLIMGSMEMTEKFQEQVKNINKERVERGYKVLATAFV